MQCTFPLGKCHFSEGVSEEIFFQAVEEEWVKIPGNPPEAQSLCSGVCGLCILCEKIYHKNELSGSFLIRLWLQ